MKPWQSILLTITLAVCLIAGSISLAFKIVPIVVSLANQNQMNQQIGQAINQLNQRVQVLEVKNEKDSK